jgi:hypothetical protein
MVGPAVVPWEAYLGNKRHGQAQGHGCGDRCAPSSALELLLRIDAISQTEIPTHGTKGDLP